MEDELFDKVDEEGRPTGGTKARRLVHRDGDWHRSLHLWLLSPAGVLLQRRGREKDTFPGMLDVSVAGHLRAGETVEDALREADEELGVTVPLEQTTPLGRRRVRHVGEAIRDFEVQSILGARLAVRLDALLGALPDVPPDASAPEVLSVVELSLDALETLSSERPVPAWEKPPGGEARRVTLLPAELVPRPDGYYGLVIAALRALAAGRPVTPFELG